MHSERSIELSVHVDDLLAVAEEADLLWMREELVEIYELKSTIF